MRKVNCVIKFEIKKLFHSPLLIVLSSVALALLIGLSLFWGSLVKVGLNTVNPTPELTNEEADSYRMNERRARAEYSILKALPTDPLEGAAPNTSIGPEYYAEEAEFYKALLKHGEDKDYVATTVLAFEDRVSSDNVAQTLKLVRYALAASVCMIFVGMFVGAYAFGNDGMGGRIKTLLASGVQRKDLFWGQFMHNAALIVGIWILFFSIGLIAFLKGATANVYNLYHTRCDVTSAIGYYLGKAGFGLLAAFLASSASAAARNCFHRTGGAFIGVPILLFFGGGVFAMFMRNIFCVSLAASRAPLLGLPLLPVAGAFSVITSVILQTLLVAGLFAVSYFAFERSDL